MDAENPRRGAAAVEDNLVEALAAVAAAPSEVLAPAPLRSRVAASLARRAAVGRYGLYADRLARLFDLRIAAAEALCKTLEDPAAWRPWLVAGTDVVPVRVGPACAGAIGGVGRLRAGLAFPHHHHVGDEVTVVLEGGIRSGHGAETWRGEELFMPAGSPHAFVVLEGSVCIAAVLATGGVTFA